MKKIYTLQGKRIMIMPLEKKHLEDFRSLRNDPETNKFLTSAAYISKAAQAKWFKTVSADKSNMYFAIKDKQGLFLGLIRCDEWDKKNKSIRVGVDIIPQKRRLGYARETYEYFLPFLFYRFQLHRVWLFVLDSNTAAFALYKKLGFQVEGGQRDAIYRDNRFHDYIMMSLLKGRV